MDNPVRTPPEPFEVGYDRRTCSFGVKSPEQWLVAGYDDVARATAMAADLNRVLAETCKDLSPQPAVTTPRTYLTPDPRAVYLAGRPPSCDKESIIRSRIGRSLLHLARVPFGVLAVANMLWILFWSSAANLELVRAHPVFSCVYCLFFGIGLVLWLGPVVASFWAFYWAGKHAEAAKPIWHVYIRYCWTTLAAIAVSNLLAWVSVSLTHGWMHVLA